MKLDRESIWRAVLSAHLSGLDPSGAAEAKYFLIRVLAEYGLSPVRDRIQEIEGRLGLPDGQIKRARDALLKAGYLKDLSAVTGRYGDDDKTGAGGKIKGFEVNDARLRECLAGVGREGLLNLELGVYASVIKSLMSPGGKMGRRVGLAKQKGPAGDRSAPLAGKQTIHELRPPTRLLLAIMLDRADACGLVRGLGMAELGALAGMRRDRLESQLEKLAAEGFLRSKVPGVTGRYAFGRANGAYFLNIEHDSLASSTPLVVVHCRDTFGAGAGHDEQMAGNRVYLDVGLKMCAVWGETKFNAPNDAYEGDGVRWVKSLLLKMADLPEVANTRDIFGRRDGLLAGKSSNALQHLWSSYKLSRFFADAPRTDFSRHLQYKVEEYASSLLTAHWHLVRGAPKGIADEVLGAILLDLCPPKIRERAERSGLPSGAVDALGLFVYVLALRMAYWVKAMLMSDALMHVWGGPDIVKVAHIRLLHQPYPWTKDAFRKVTVAICFKDERATASKTLHIKRVIGGDNRAVLASIDDIPAA